MSEFTHLLERIDGQSRRAAAACSASGYTPRQVEDLLTEGYLAALTGESGSRRLAERLELLAQNLESGDAAIEARRLAREKRTLDEKVRLLREQLAQLRTHLSDRLASS